MTKDVLLTISGMHYDMTGIPDEDGSEEENQHFVSEWLPHYVEVTDHDHEH